MCGQSTTHIPWRIAREHRILPYLFEIVRDPIDDLVPIAAKDLRVHISCSRWLLFDVGSIKLCMLIHSKIPLMLLV
jgi:hypothetical protein